MAVESAPQKWQHDDALPARSALVTGASRGIGLEIARRLAGEGFDLTISARREAGLLEAVEILRTEGSGTVHAVVANLATATEVPGLVDEHERRFGDLDLLVMNAGVAAAGTVGEMSMKNYDLVMNVNLRSQFLIVQRALPLLRKASARNPATGARIVALASITGVAAESTLSAYGASKAGLISLCEAVSLEESDNGVSATALSPGFVATDMTAQMPDSVEPDTMLQSSDVAEMVVALTRMSAKAVVPNIVISRAGPAIWRA
ncbi:SDR family NAD(P)-dependent oxidoreductase [Gordonia sp. DT30]|uniref:SDR family NAD(P)-dependent oxidoreductase n=1 Tax=Gordonia sp. DT30 TaxID=3416546 RepID=UPI003CF18350